MTERLGDWLARGPFGLAMSSGFFGFYAHTGMLAALTARGFLPNLVAGSSSGAMVGGAFAAGAQPAELAEVLVRLQRADFWDPAPGAGLLAGKKFDELLRGMLPTHAFEGCRVPLKISVFDIYARKTVVLATGDLAHAIRASCAVPAMFHPVWIAGRPYWDGGILDRPGIAGVPPGRVLFHHLTGRPPWRRAGAPPPGLPRRTELVSLVIDELPGSGPFRMAAGHRAMALARAATERALDQPIVDSVVRVTAGASAAA
jgi:NTE family protein